MYKALSLIPSTAKEKRRKGKKIKEIISEKMLIQYAKV
jgi:hypothetical protein